MFMTKSFNVTPKTTEQHLISRSDKSVPYVTNNKRLCSTFCTVEANWQTRTKHRAASLRQKLVIVYKRHTIRDDGNVSIEKGAMVLHILLTAPPRLSICFFLTHLFFFFFVTVEFVPPPEIQYNRIQTCTTSMTCTTCSKAMDECHHYSDANFWRFASGRGYIIIIIIIIIIYSYKKLSDATNTTNSWWMRTRSHLADAEPPMCSAIYLVYFTHNAGFTYSFWRIRRACVVFLKYTILIACRKLLHYRLISRRFVEKKTVAMRCVVL